jgi:hypothetical protein
MVLYGSVYGERGDIKNRLWCYRADFKSISGGTLILSCCITLSESVVL